MPKIEFILPKELNENAASYERTNENFPIGDGNAPQPASSLMPSEYKKLSSYVENDMRFPTVKKCMPFLDAMTAGYIIPFYQEHIVTVDAKKNKIEVQSGRDPGGQHYSKQMPEDYQSSQKDVQKFSNKWIIKTPPGYSCLFVHPMNRPKNDFEIISGIVDTDVYDLMILFPYYWRRYEEGKPQVLLKKGSPMVQVIPFKRESWSSWSGIVKRKPKSTHWAGRLMEIYKRFYWKKKKYE